MVTNTEAHIDTDKETGIVMHGQSHGERTRGHADSDTFKFMVTTQPRALDVTGTTTETDKIIITDTVTNTNWVTVMDSDTDTDMVTRAGTLIDSH